METVKKVLKRFKGFLFLPAFLFRPLLLGLRLDGKSVSTNAEEILGDGGNHSSGHVWERGGLGHSSLSIHSIITLGGIGEKPVVLMGTSLSGSI